MEVYSSLVARKTVVFQLRSLHAVTCCVREYEEEELRNFHSASVTSVGVFDKRFASEIRMTSIFPITCKNNLK